MLAKVRTRAAERDAVEDAAQATLRRLQVRRTVSVVLTGDAEIRKLNRRYRRRDKTTDVLSFTGTAGYAGDVLISLPEARREARRRSVSIPDELRLLAVHGVLHCLGFDHERPADAKKMLPLQAKILDELRITNNGDVNHTS